MTFINDTGASSPVFDYSSRDYNSIFSDLVKRIPVYLPEWTSTSNNDFGMVLLQMFAYCGDLLGYYLDRLAGEAFIQTATQASSIINLAAMLDYQPTLSSGATVSLQITIASNLGPPITPLTIPAGTQFSTKASPSQPSIVFETDASLTIAGSQAATPSVTGIVDATQGVTHSNEQIGISTGGINQIYSLLYNPVSANSFSVFIDLGIGLQEWTYVSSLIDSGPFDAVFTNYVDANGVFYIVLGDGVNGYVPPLGSLITCTYQTNVGLLGNVGVGTINQPVSALIGVNSVTNAQAASGGTPAESLNSIRIQAPASLRTLNRGVTENDVQVLAQQVAGVQWASAEEVTYQLVNLFIAPFGGGSPSSLLISAIQNYVDPKMMANTTVTIFPPVYVPINVTVNVTAYNNFGNTTVELTVLAALSSLLALSNTGFGGRASLGLIYQIVLAQTGVNYAIVTNLNRQMLVTLTTPLVSGNSYTHLGVSPLPQPVFAGDVLTLTNLLSVTQTNIVVGSAGAITGATSIPVTSFVANAAYPVGSAVQDVTGTNDCVLLANEIPVAGTLTVNVTGGLVGS